jgi:hypothetical protein
VRVKLWQHKESLLDDDPNLPEELQLRAEATSEKYRKLAREMAKQPVEM